MQVDHANLIMQYLSIQWFDLETGHTVATVRISKSFLWYAMNDLMHVMQRQIDACNAIMIFKVHGGHSSHSLWLNYGCKIECLHTKFQRQKE